MLEPARTLKIPIGRGGIFTIAFPADLTAEDLAIVYATLELWEPNIIAGEPVGDPAAPVADADTPRRLRWRVPAGSLHPNGSTAEWRHGCYFPLTDLIVTDMGSRGTGAPDGSGLAWIDQPPPNRRRLVTAEGSPPTLAHRGGPPEDIDTDGDKMAGEG